MSLEFVIVHFSVTHPLTAAFCETRVTWATPVPPCSLPIPSVLDLGPLYATD